MEHNKVSTMMAGWYKMFGANLEIRPQNIIDKELADMLTGVVVQMGESVSGDQSQTMEEKEEAQEKSYCEATASSVPVLLRQEQTSSLIVELRDDSNGQDLKLELSQ